MLKKMFRQGDVLIEEVDEIPKGSHTEIARDGGRVVLAYGEVTGHAHALTDDSVMLMSFKPERGTTPDRFLKVGRQSTLRHEEHGPIELPAGKYRITIQRQWDQAQGWRTVVD